MELLHSPAALQLSSRHLQHFLYHRKPHFQSYLCNSIISTNSFGPKKPKLSITQQNSIDPLDISLLFPHNFTLYNTSSLSRITPSISSSTVPPLSFSASNITENVHWMVIIDKPPQGIQTKTEIINYYVSILVKTFGSEMDAQSCIYHASCSTHFGFCCIIGEETARFIAGLPGVLSVKPDPDIESVNKDYDVHNNHIDSMSNSLNHNALLFPKGSKYWLVRIEPLSRRVVSKADAVDYYVKLLTKVLGNETDAQMCLYHVSWQSNFGFCCVLDDESMEELVSVPGVLSVQTDEHFESENKDYGGHRLQSSTSDFAQANDISKTKLFITGLSFYTSEKTLRAAFEPFGELVEVKIIMDKISKRSKGYAFVEYSNEDAATKALHEMNGKIINGWMIVVDRAKRTPRRIRERAR
ncbi:organelle RRM domain-containing protein 1, chloroplastic isoform X1 [Amaranthus tricolor]|uniref:organelle RRM domain-containing protein 1, chloroplastic isoform X1 n=1 Tax=Amaranthus tricolor TaxID=29722 RepID=UPI002587DC3B|nr:organelle RRM domain-containing protein 1, chloroplastic isoform X1 [Amaranthus tricolor]